MEPQQRKALLGQQCQICSADCAYTQYGAIACRACGTFFRRLSLLKRTYPCTCQEQLQQQQQQLDQLDQEMMMLHFKDGMKRIPAHCKGCRQQKCMAMGMSVQKLRSLPLREFHRQRQLQMAAITKAKVAADSSALLGQLLQMEAIVHRIRNSPTPVPDDFLEWNIPLDIFVGNQQRKSLLCQQHRFSSAPMPGWDKARTLEAMYRWGGFSQPLHTASKDLLLCVEMARALPAFQRIDIGDKVALLKSSALAANFLLTFYVSAQQKSDTLLVADGGQLVPMFTAVAQRCHWDPNILHASTRSFVQPMADFLRVDLCREEFVLLFAMLLSNSSSSSLSTHGQRVLKAEEERLGQTLLRWQQHRYGAAAGALRYMESLQMLCAALNIARLVRQIYVYIDSVYEQGQLERAVPKLLVPLMN